MDAAYISVFKKTVFFLTLTLLLAAPFAAQGQTFNFPGGATATVIGQQAGCTVVASSGSNFTFTATQVAVAGNPTLSISPGGTMTTGGQVCFTIGSLPAGASGTYSIQINLTSVSPAGITGQITVSVTPNGNGGTGTGTGSTGSGLTPQYLSNPITLSSTFGSLASTTFTLTNSTVGAINYTVGIPAYDATGSGWLIIPSGTVPANTSISVPVQGNPTGLSNGNHTATFTITYTGGGNGTISNIPVTFSVNGTTGNGSLSANPSTITWNYNTSAGTSISQQIANQSVTITSSTGASTYSYTVQTSGSNGYLLLANSQTSGSQVPITTPLVISPTSNIAPLTTGTYQETIQLTDSNGNSGLITVNLSINGAQSTGLTISPAPISLNAAVGLNSYVQTNVTVTSNLTGTVNLSISGVGLILAGSITTETLNVTAGIPTTFVVYGNPVGLASNTYIGSLTATEGSLTQTTQVNFVVGAGSGTTSGTVAPTSLQFYYEQGQPASGSSSSLVPQSITQSVAGAFTTAVTSGSNWLSVSPSSGSGPGSISVSVSSGVSSLAASGTPYPGSFTVTTSDGAVHTVSVSLLVTPSTSPVVFANPPVVNASYTGGSSSFTTVVQVLSSDGTGIAVQNPTSSQSWLTVQATSATTTAGFVLTVNGAALANGVNVANLTMSTGAANPTLTVPVVVSVSGSTVSGGALTLGSSSLSFSGQVNGTAPAAQTLSVTATSATNYTATATTQNGGNWLNISPSGSLNTSSTSSLSVSANQAGLATGTYSGTISLATSAGTQNVSVTLVVGATSGGSTLVPSSASLTFSAPGGAVPAAQNFSVSTNNSSTVSFTVAATTANGGNWLSASPSSSSAPGGTVSVSINPTGLAAGTYTGSITLTPAGGTATTVPVTLTVTGLPTVSTSPATLSLTYQAGATNPPTGTIQVSGTAASLPFTAAASSTGGWLAVTPTSGDTGASGTALTVTVTPTGLTAGTYTGTVVVTAGSSAAGGGTTTVTLTVTAPLPTISSVQSAASFATGPVSPGEIVSIFGPSTNPIGPGTPASLTLDSNGNVTTTLGGVQVLFNGIPAPLTYVSSTQINAIVPYGVAGLFSPYVQVKYLGQSSNAYNLSTAATAPAIFSQNGSGTGPGAILNQNGTVNSATAPAAKGSVVAVYMTGEGQTSPAGITGKVNCPSGASCSLSQLPVPLLPVTVTLVDSTGARFPANYTFAGEAPGFVSGVMQVNATIPANVSSGTLQLFVSVGGNNSQSGITVAIQ